MNLSQWSLLINARQISSKGDFAWHSRRSVNTSDVFASLAHLWPVTCGVVNLASAVSPLLGTSIAFGVVNIHGTGPVSCTGRKKRRYIRISIKFFMENRAAMPHSQQVAIGHVHLLVVMVRDVSNG